LWISQV